MSDHPSKYTGVRKRKWGKWVSEIRLPHSRERIWLGSYDSAEKAARAFDAAQFCLRGLSANFNFPDNPPVIPGAGHGMSPAEIQSAAAKYANMLPPIKCNIDGTAHDGEVDVTATDHMATPTWSSSSDGSAGGGPPPPPHHQYFNFDVAYTYDGHVGSKEDDYDYGLMTTGFGDYDYDFGFDDPASDANLQLR